MGRSAQLVQRGATPHGAAPGARLRRIRPTALGGLLALAGCADAPIAEPAVVEPEAVRCTAGDDPGWASPAFDDSGWPELRVALPRTGWPGSDEVFWCRATLALPADRPAALQVAALGTKQVFADGTRVIDERGPLGSYLARLAPLPDAATADGTVHVAVRLEVDRTWTQQAGPRLGRIAAGTPLDVQAASERARYDAFLRQLPGWITSLVLAFVAVFQLVFHARGAAFSGNLAFAVGVACVSANVVLDSALGLALIPLFPGYRTVLMAIIATSYVATFVALQQLFGGPRSVLWALCALMYARFALMTWWPAIAIPLGIPHTLTVVVLGGGFVAWMALRGWRADLPGARIVALSALVLLAGPLGYLASLVWPDARVALGAEWAGAASSLAGTLGMAWAFSVERLVRSTRDLGATHQAALRFVPVEFLERLGRSSVKDVERGDAARAHLTVLFLDIRGFTTIAEANAPEVVFRLVNDLMDLLEPTVRAHGGFLNGSTGDGFVALFPTADGAIRAAAGMRGQLAARLASGATPAVRAGIGAHSGPVLLGTVGGATYLTPGMVGDTMNVAARVEGLTKLYGADVLVTSATVAEATVAPRLREIDRVVVKGRSEPIGLYEVLDGAPDPDVEAAFQHARARYAAGAFREAADGFRPLPLAAAAALCARCEALAAAPPDQWDGVWRLDHK